MKIILLTLLIILSSCKNKTKSTNFQKETKKIDTIKYGYKGFNSGIKLHLFSNGNFYYNIYLYGCTGGGKNEKVYGKYTMNHQKLILYPDSISVGIIQFMRHDKPIISNLKYGVDSLKIPTKYEIIKWHNISYLLSEEKDLFFRYWYPMMFVDDKDYVNEINKWNDYYEFAYRYNSGLEPQFHGRYLTRIETESIDSLNNQFDIKKINKKWQHLFLEKPLTGIVLDIKKRKKKDPYEFDSYSVVINKGSLNGVNIGVVKFKRKNFDDHIEIIKVFPNKSIGIFYRDENVKKIKVGDTLTTSGPKSY